MALDEITRIKRTIHYYELKLLFQEDFQPSDGNQFREFFRIIHTLAQTRAKIRYQSFGEKAIFIQDLKIEPSSKTITGKLRCIRKDILPEIMNTKTDEARGIEAADEEGLLETTHFLIDYSKVTKKLSIEYNQFGSKIGDFTAYLQNIGIHKGVLKNAEYIPIVKDELKLIPQRINRCSEFTVKVHKDNIPQIEKMDKQIYSALKAASDHFSTDYATIVLKFDYHKKNKTSLINTTIFNLIKGLTTDKTKAELFEKLEIRAEDKQKENLLETFDLLIDKVKSEVLVQKKRKYRTVVSADMFEIMKYELIRKQL